MHGDALHADHVGPHCLCHWQHRHIAQQRSQDTQDAPIPFRQRARKGFGAGGGGLGRAVASIILGVPQHASLFGPFYWYTCCPPHHLRSNVPS